MALTGGLITQNGITALAIAAADRIGVTAMATNGMAADLPATPGMIPIGMAVIREERAAAHMPRLISVRHLQSLRLP